MSSSAAGSVRRRESALDKDGPKDELLRPAEPAKRVRGESEMPIYEYKCDDCGKVFEVLQKKFDVDEAPCACGASGHRIMSNTSFVLKGTGWYVTDYKGNGSCPANNGGSNGNGKSAGSDAASSSGDAAASSPCAKAGADGGCGSCKTAPAAAASGS